MSIPSWARSVFATFPLCEWEAARAVDPPAEVRTRAALYVARGHPRPLGIGNGRGHSWASADPRCLRWQMELLLRGIDYDAVQVDEADGWAAGTALPFAQQPGSSRLVAEEDLAGWCAKAYNSKKVAPAEAALWKGVLATRVMAGVQLQRALVSALLPIAPSHGLLGRALRAHLKRNDAELQLRRVDALSGRTRTAARPRRGLSRFLAGVSVNGTTLGDDDEAEDPRLIGTRADVDAEAIMRDAERALSDVLQRLEAGTSDGDALLDVDPALDALLFAILHTILSLPDGGPLREAVEGSELAMRWVRRLYQQYIRPREQQ